LSGFIVVFVTVPNCAEAKKLAKLLLEKKLAACVNIVPKIESHYWWKGKLEKASELLLIIKTRKTLFPKLAAQVRKNHSYSVPEIISLPVADGSKAYLDWLKENTVK
jgi:periplasmic divalent cation tolerance protein